MLVNVVILMATIMTENSLYYGDKLNLSCYQKVKDIYIAGELDQGRSCRVDAHCVLPFTSYRNFDPSP